LYQQTKDVAFVMRVCSPLVLTTVILGYRLLSVGVLSIHFYQVRKPPVA
jgi:hypothetical protein